MDELRKQKIAESFPGSFEQAELGISISKTEFNIFEVGIYSYSMDDKWNVFVIDDIIFFARSWTDHCIYKVFTEPFDNNVLLQNFHVNRDFSQYKRTVIEEDVVVLRKLLQNCLKREDFYSDPMLELTLIKQTTEKEDHSNNYAKSIGQNTVGVTRQTWQALIVNSNGFYEVRGWEELEKEISNKSDDEILISLCLQQKGSHSSKTFYFNKGANEFLGEIIITETIKWKNLYNL